MDKKITELGSMLFAYYRRIYPSFIYKKGVTEAFPPVFYYHNVHEAEFENQLRYLLSNEYVSVFCDEYINGVLAKPRYHPKKVIMLTFDDGLASLYLEVFPLIRRYNVKIVAYIIPAWVEKPGFLTWDQCREMHQTGLVDFQSHSLTHSKLVTDIAIRDLRAMEDRGMPWDVPGMCPVDLIAAFRSAPIFCAHSLFEAESALHIPAAIWGDLLMLEQNYRSSRAMNNRIPKKGHLRNSYKHFLEQNCDNIEYRNSKEIYNNILFELNESKNRIQSEIPGHKVSHFAFPWSKSSDMAWQALKEEGYKSAAAGLNVNNERFDKHLPVMNLFRVNGDFVYCLPGDKRRSFFFVMSKKIRRRWTYEKKRNLGYDRQS